MIHPQPYEVVAATFHEGVVFPWFWIDCAHLIVGKKKSAKGLPVQTFCMSCKAWREPLVFPIFFLHSS